MKLVPWKLSLAYDAFVHMNQYVIYTRMRSDYNLRLFLERRNLIIACDACDLASRFIRTEDRHAPEIGAIIRWLMDDVMERYPLTLCVLPPAGAELVGLITGDLKLVTEGIEEERPYEPMEKYSKLIKEYLAVDRLLQCKPGKLDEMEQAIHQHKLVDLIALDGDLQVLNGLRGFSSAKEVAAASGIVDYDKTYDALEKRRPDRKRSNRTDATMAALAGYITTFHSGDCELRLITHGGVTISSWKEGFSTKPEEQPYLHTIALASLLRVTASHSLRSRCEKFLSKLERYADDTAEMLAEHPEVRAFIKKTRTWKEQERCAFLRNNDKDIKIPADLGSSLWYWYSTLLPQVNPFYAMTEQEEAQLLRVTDLARFIGEHRDQAIKAGTRTVKDLTDLLKDSLNIIKFAPAMGTIEE